MSCRYGGPGVGGSLSLARCEGLKSGVGLGRPAAKPLRLLWWNVGGLSDTGRQAQVINQLNIHQPDVVALSEIQFADEDEFEMKVNARRTDPPSRPLYDLFWQRAPPRRPGGVVLLVR